MDVLRRITCEMLQGERRDRQGWRKEEKFQVLPTTYTNVENNITGTCSSLLGKREMFLSAGITSVVHFTQEVQYVPHSCTSFGGNFLMFTLEECKQYYFGFQ